MLVVEQFLLSTNALSIFKVHGQMYNSSVFFVYWKAQNAPNCFIAAYVSAHLITCYFVVNIYILNTKYNHIAALMNVYVDQYFLLVHEDVALLEVIIC